ncbi:unnamed protein product [Caenorhabditis angaria]|uniref:Uncharacterized protein n=1 Tax=Caenorhabditis angaria TaxID=860376 RepID=A0A9P1IR73_9PELO|nr:unnamed protein product [Caenorhabditis angaria]
MEFSQEVISILVIVIVCSVLSLFCVFLWFCRCRKDQIRAAEEKHDRAVQMQHFEDQEKAKKTETATLRVASTLEADRSTQNLQSHRSVEESNETIGQFETRTNLKTQPEMIRNKRLDTISEMAISNESLQRNDSKTNVFTVDSLPKASMLEVDLNPGLDNSINLEKI